MSSNYLISRYDGYNVAAPGANTSILATSLTPKRGVGAFRVTVILAATSVFNLYTDDGTTQFTTAFNSGAALTAAQIFTFSFGVTNSKSYNFQVATNGVIRLLQIDETEFGVI